MVGGADPEAQQHEVPQSQSCLHRRLTKSRRRHGPDSDMMDRFNWPRAQPAFLVKDGAPSIDAIGPRAQGMPACPGPNHNSRPPSNLPLRICQERPPWPAGMLSSSQSGRQPSALRPRRRGASVHVVLDLTPSAMSRPLRLWLVTGLAQISRLCARELYAPFTQDRQSLARALTLMDCIVCDCPCHLASNIEPINSIESAGDGVYPVRV